MVNDLFVSVDLDSFCFGLEGAVTLSWKWLWVWIEKFWYVLAELARLNRA